MADANPNPLRLSDRAFDAKVEALCAARRARVQRGIRPGPADYRNAMDLAMCATPEQRVRMRRRLAQEQVAYPDPKQRGRA